MSEETEIWEPSHPAQQCVEVAAQPGRSGHRAVAYAPLMRPRTCFDRNAGGNGAFRKPAVGARGVLSRAVKLRVSAVAWGQPFDISQRLINVILDVRIAVFGAAGVQMHLDPWTVL